MRAGEEWEVSQGGFVASGGKVRVRVRSKHHGVWHLDGKELLDLLTVLSEASSYFRVYEADARARGEERPVKKTAKDRKELVLEVLRCPIHPKFLAVAIDAERITPGKCCGRWQTVASWKIDDVTERYQIQRVKDGQS